LSSSARIVAEAARAHAEFRVLLPRRLPVGYRLAGVLCVPGLGSALTLEFRGWRSGLWTLTERRSLLTFDEELASTSTTWQTVVRDGRRFAYAAASWHGEPVERHITASRQTMWWQQDGLMIELERIEGHSPSWRRLWRVIDTLR
jgi:hypothetical protein